MTSECKAERCAFRFCKAIARLAMRSVVDKTVSGGGRRLCSLGYIERKDGMRSLWRRSMVNIPCGGGW